MLDAYVFTMFMSSWWILPLSIMEIIWVSFMALVLKSILSDMSIATPACFSCPFAWNIFFQPYTFIMCRSFVLRWVSYRQHMCGSWFLTHSAILCVLIGAFNPFMFRVIIDRYLFIVILLSLYLCSSLSYCFSSCSYSRPFSISCRAGLEEVYSLRLLLSRKLLIWPSILIESLDG